MNILQLVIIAFLILETTNVIALYFFPDSKYANSVGVFSTWEQSKQDPEVHNLLKYLVNWVAGTKIIFIMLLIVILLIADEQELIYVGMVMIFSIGTYFWRLNPLIRKMDSEGQVEPKKYSVILRWMIAAMIGTFLVAVIVTSI